MRHKTPSKVHRSKRTFVSKYALRLACAGMMVLQIVQIVFVYSMYTPSLSSTTRSLPSHPSSSQPSSPLSTSFLTYIPGIADLKTKLYTTSKRNPQRTKLLQDAITEIEHDTHILLDEMFAYASSSSNEKRISRLAEKMNILIDVGSKRHKGLDRNKAAMRDTTAIIKCTSATSPQDIETRISQIRESSPKIRLIIAGKTTWSRRATSRDKSKYVLKLGDVSLKYILQRVVRTPYVLYVVFEREAREFQSFFFFTYPEDSLVSRTQAMSLTRVTLLCPSLATIPLECYGNT